MKRKKKAKKRNQCGEAFKFGITTDYRCAGYIMPNGHMLDFCERDNPWKNNNPPEYLMKYWIKKKEDRKRLVGKRMYDHQEIALAFNRDVEKQFADESTPFQKKCDAVRFSIYDTEDAEIMMVESQNRPTPDQVQTIQSALRNTLPDKLHLYGPRSGDCYDVKYDPIRPLDIQKWISNCWG